jgi:DNA (cytosine-5)-methyltransferase 1
MKVLDLFSGIGGFSLGLERAGFKTVAFCEIDKKARMVLQKHWPTIPIFDDVTTLTKDKLDAHGISVDVICGGFPCQDLSVAGKGAGLEGSRSGLWFEFHRLIKEIRPSWVIVENVSVLRSRGLDRVLRSLAEIGYDAEWHCIPASAVGAPHQRDRIWIVAYPGDEGLRPCSGRDGVEPHQQNQGRDDFQGRGRANVGLASSGKPPNMEKDVVDPTGGRRESLSHGNTKPNNVIASSSVANSGSAGLQRDEWGRETRTQRISKRYITQCGWWEIEPDVGRVANGVPGRVDRLKQLGNSVVPQIPEMLGKAIKLQMQLN